MEFNLGDRYQGPVDGCESQPIQQSSSRLDAGGIYAPVVAILGSASCA